MWNSMYEIFPYESSFEWNFFDDWIIFGDESTLIRELNSKLASRRRVACDG